MFTDDAMEVVALQNILRLPDWAQISFLTWAKRSGISIALESYVLLGPATNCILAQVETIMCVSEVIYISFALFAEHIEVDEYEGLYAIMGSPSDKRKLMALADAPVTALWHYEDQNDARKLLFIVKW